MCKLHHLFVTEIYKETERDPDGREHDVHEHDLRRSHLGGSGQDRVVAQGGCDHDKSSDGSLDFWEEHVADRSSDLKQSAGTGPSDDKCTCDHQRLALSTEYDNQSDKTDHRVDDDEAILLCG